MAGIARKSLSPSKVARRQCYFDVLYRTRREKRILIDRFDDRAGVITTIRSTGMKRIASIATAAALALAVGCQTDKQKHDASVSAANNRYKILSGSTSETSHRDENGFDRDHEPALNPGTRFAAGQVCETQGHLDCAVVQYDQALRLNPKHIPSLYRMGVVMTKLKKYDTAVAMWQRYIDATDNSAAGYSNLGFCYEMAADVDNAEAAYKKGIAIDEKSTPCRVNYGLMLARQNRQDEAEEQLATVLSPSEVAYNMASVYEQQGAIARAKEELQKAIAANPNMREAQDKLATLPQELP
jgi:tetratricopeptide (TPR) repeat protein